MRKQTLHIDYETLIDFLNITAGVFAPLDGFMDSADFHSMIDNMTLKNGSVFTVPITFPIEKSHQKNLLNISIITLTYKGKEIGYIEIKDIYETSKKDFYEIFQTRDLTHPGLEKSLSKSRLCVGGRCILTDTSLIKRLEMITPEQTKKIFQKRGWKTVVGFHTRNAVHRAHEHLQRIGLELCDGLFINPLMGWKKKGDFTEEAIKKAYEVMIKKFYPNNRVFFHGLRVSTRYAGPREAVFTAIMRRNLGCTHFIVGRDHSGVDGFYGKYDSQKLAEELQKKYGIGINLLLLSEPFYCKKCGQTVSEKTCGHSRKEIIDISGTKIRKSLLEKTLPPSYMMRPEIAKVLEKLDNIFVL